MPEFVLPNASFETSDLSQWTGTGGPSIQRFEDETAPDGDWTLQVTKGSTGLGGVRTQTLPADPSTEHKVRMMVKAPNGVAYDIQFSERNSGGSEDDYTLESYIGTGDWQQVEVTHTNSATGVNMRWYLLTEEAGTFYVDAVPPPSPEAKTGVSSDRGTTTATVHGTVQPGGLQADWWFEYGLDTNYGNSTPVEDAGDGTDEVPVQAALSGLTDNSVYHYRLAVETSEGVIYGTDMVFGTDPIVGEDVLAYDTCTHPDPVPKWRKIDAQDDSRHQWFETGGPDGGPFRRMTLIDGDDPGGFGERSELGRNNNPDTFHNFEEGSYTRTELHIRLADDFPTNAETWQLVSQMKQCQPYVSANPSWTILELNVLDGQWQVSTARNGGDINPICPALVDEWIKIEWTVRHSQDPEVGTVQVKIIDSEGEHLSELIECQTCAVEEGPLEDWSIIEVGETIPSHLRIGVYRDAAISGDTHADYGPTMIFSVPEPPPVEGDKNMLMMMGVG